MGCQYSSITQSFHILSIPHHLSQKYIDVYSKNNNDKHYKESVKRQTKTDKNHDTSRSYALIPKGSAIVVH